MVQVETFGVSLNAEGTCFYGMQVEAVMDRIKDNISLDHLARYYWCPARFFLNRGFYHLAVPARLVGSHLFGRCPQQKQGQSDNSQ